MVRKKTDDVWATKADVQLVKADVQSLRADMNDLQTQLLKTIDEKTCRLAIEIVRTNDRIDALRVELKQEMRDFRSDMIGRMDAFLVRFETIWRESAVFPKILDEHGATLRGHETRIQTLEVRCS